jgi:hypothetical protein
VILLADSCRKRHGMIDHAPKSIRECVPSFASKADHIVRLFEPTVAAAKLGVTVDIVAARRAELGL